MSKKRKFLLNGLVLTMVGLVMRAVALYLGAYISGVIGAEGIGLQSLIGTVYSLAVTLATSGVGLSVTRLVAASIGESESERIRKALTVLTSIRTYLPIGAANIANNTVASAPKTKA